MLNHEGSRHEYFEELCAIAAGGQISEAEFLELQNHLQHCADCRSVYGEFVDLLHDKLPLAHPELVGPSNRPGFFSKTPSYRERFLARARMEGVAVPLEPRETVTGRLWSLFSSRSARNQLMPAAIAVLLMAVVLLSCALYESDLRNRRLGSQRTEPGQPAPPRDVRISPMPQESAPNTLPSRDAVPAARKAESGSTPDGQMTAELARVREENAAAETQSKIVEDRLTQAITELGALRARNERSNASREELEKELRAAEQLVNRMKEDLQEIRQARSRDALLVSSQSLEIQKISERLAEQTNLLAQERSLLETSREVRDLMGSRSFHIADVFDVDSKGKDRQAFGRIFYSEGKSLMIMYAFDLNDRNTARRNASFQVWGRRGPTESSIYSLGLFQIDDQRQNRWVLRSEDTKILAQIDSVFVTVEPAGGSPKPTGPEFLYAYLDANSNR